MNRLNFASKKAVGFAALAFFFSTFSSILSADPFCNQFRRGDTNGDGVVDMSDGIATLEFLFLGKREILCRDAADADGSVALDLSDPIVTLQYLFLGEAPPPFPGPLQCGRLDFGAPSLGCDSYESCGARPEIGDFSGFQHFEFVQEGALGFCAEVNRVFSATILKQDGLGQAGSDYLLRMSVLREGRRGVDPCLDDQGIFTAECPYVDELPERRLNDDEAGMAAEVFRRVEVLATPDPICQCVVIDPCLIQSFRWDGQTIINFPCSTPRLEDGQAGVILNLLERLRGGI